MTGGGFVLIQGMRGSFQAYLYRKKDSPLSATLHVIHQQDPLYDEGLEPYSFRSAATPPPQPHDLRHYGRMT